MNQPHAAPEATQAFSQAHADLAYAPLGSTGLTVSAAGFGGYRIDARVQEHHQALTLALASGINLVDTSTNYTDGQSETLVGQVLAELATKGRLSREQVVVVTKAGYLQGSNYALSQQRKAEGHPFPELVEFSPGLEHCLHPEFLEDQLTRSLERLGLASVDVLLLHNPEYYLVWAAQQGLPLEQARAEYYRRLGQAFAHLEAEARRGRIAFYGLSSNTFPAPPEAADFTSLERCWDLAQALGADHRFRVVQFPLNLLEPAAVLLANQSQGRSVLGLARDLGLGVLTNRTLNALRGEQLVRLAEVDNAPAAPPGEQEITGAIEALARSEERVKQELLAALGLEEAPRRHLEEYLSAAPLLAEHWRDFQGLEHWLDTESQHLLPRILAALRYAGENLPEDAGRSELARDHLELVGAAFAAVGALYAFAAAEQAAGIKARVTAVAPAWAQAPRLSQMALRAVRSTAGVSAALVGMRRPRYVADVLTELRRPVERQGREASWLNMLRSGLEKTA